MTAVIGRRRFLQYSAAVGATATAVGATGTACTADAPVEVATTSDDDRWNEATIDELQRAMERGETTASQLVDDFLDRIERLDWSGPRLNSVIEVNPDAEAIALALDEERAEGHVRGPMHGIPILLKDCIATADRMQTTAGSLALVGSKVPRDAGVVTKLRDAGAIVLGKANMSEWNAFRGYPTRGGWSARAGIGLNPYALSYSTGDSSSGSAAAVAANLAVGAVGLETYGSIVMPASLCGVVGLRPTMGLISRSGTIPISTVRDTTGPIARTVADLAIMLGAMVGADPLDPVTRESAGRLPRDRAVLDPGGLRRARIGIWRSNHVWKGEGVAEVVEPLVGVLEELGAIVFDPVYLPEWKDAIGWHTSVMLGGFRADVDAYLRELSDTRIRSLADVVAFNEEHADQELQWHNQALLEGALDTPPPSDPASDWMKSRRISARLARAAFAGAMDRHRLDAVFCPTFVTPWAIDLLNGDDPLTGNGAAGPSNAAGYPHVTLPAGFVGELPVGVSFMGRAWDEPKLLRYAFALEQAVQARRSPKFLADYGATDFVERGVLNDPAISDS
jgi:amidase